MTREEEIDKIASAFAIDEVKDTCNPASKRGLLCVGFVAGAEWADAHPHWISIEESLPKDRQPCIVLIDRKAIQGTPRIRSAVYAPNVMMQQEGFVYSHMSKKHHITHWMPLPQAPKKGGEK